MVSLTQERIGTTHELSNASRSGRGGGEAGCRGGGGGEIKREIGDRD